MRVVVALGGNALLKRGEPMTAEAQWDLPNAAARRQVTACLERHYDGTTIMASMGSLGHHMQELSRSGIRIREFLHEGNGEVWKAAVQYGPRPYVRWVAIEESAEGGDAVAARLKAYPQFLAGFERVAEGGGVALYRAQRATP